MGVVYRAEDTTLGRDVALKVLPEEMAADPERLERFKREAQAIAALNHPNIVTIYSVEEAEGVNLLTMELVDGRPLADVIPRTGLPLSRFLRIAIPLAEAVNAAHEKGIVHRDLKPGNVIVTEDDEVFESGGVQIVVARDSLALIDGTEVDFVKSGLNEAFKFRNPNVAGECGCGESFSV